MFGDFLKNNEELDFFDLQKKEQGTPIVARYSNRMFQFGIYCNDHVIFQRCNIMGTMILFTIEKWSIDDFCANANLYEYTPQFNFDKSITYANAVHYLVSRRGNAVPASISLCSVYGDDFALICMVGKESFANAFHYSKMGKHFLHNFYIAGMAPAQHHLLAIEEGFVIHFSRGDSNDTSQIILEEFDHVEKRAYDKWGSKLVLSDFEQESLDSLLKARNRALLVFAGFVPFGDYNLMTNNCEHFVKWCKDGRATSKQVRNFFVDTASILASVILRTPAPLMARLAQRKLLFD